MAKVHPAEETKNDTKKYIVKTARQLFSEFSYLGVSMEDIAKKLHITKAALYYHFAGKAEIYAQVLDDVFFDLDSKIAEALAETSAEARLHELVKGYLDFGCREKNLIKSIMLKLTPADAQIKHHIADLRRKLADMIRPAVEEVSNRNTNGRKTDVRLVTSLLTGMMDSLLLEYSFLGKKMDSNKVANQIIAVIHQ